MSKISLLPPDLANQIAAGEVIERPASVVKELVENALDAGARRLVIHVELGGKKQVRVEDDGEGMEPADARLAIERHATSKIRHADDLASIRSLGFRGEALPSIASVSHFVLRTRARREPSGTELCVNGGALASVTEIGSAEGTVVVVNDLFYNLPARRKFLKSDGAESAQVSRIVTQLALAYHEAGFTLTSAGRTLLDCPPAGSLRDRFYQIYGERDDLIEVSKSAGGLRLTGYIAALAGKSGKSGTSGASDGGPTRGVQHVFVNRRIVKDKTIAHAILDAYSVASIKERSPEVHLFLEMPPDALDVNVHPTKAEVRFREQSLVHEVVRRALMDALGHTSAPHLELRPQTTPLSDPVAAAIPGILAGGTYPNRWLPQPSPADVVSGFQPSPAEGGLRLGRAEASTASPEAEAGSRTAVTADQGEAIRDIRPMIPLGQFRDTFIVAIDDEGIAIIDQHVAHERVLFERVMERLMSDRLESQRLLVPMVLELPPSAHDTLISRAAELGRLGFEVESFGGNAINVTAVPALLNADESSKTLQALAEDLERLDRGADVEQALKRLAATTACHAAVKANYPLSYEKMAHILDELRATAYSSVCPHGRPVMLRLTRREIEKNFERI
jgi:DNA mismatch repair protein MutL